MKNAYFSKHSGIKVLSLFLSFILIAFSIIPAISVSASTIPEIGIEEFSLELCEMLEEAEANSSHSISDSTQNDEIYAQFKSKRLIVDSKKKLNTLNATDVVCGYRNLWILQYETVKDTVSAYEYYSSLSYVNSVEPDEEIFAAENEISPEEVNTEEFLSWGPEFCGFDEVLDEIEDYHLPKIYVAVVDSGVWLTHPFLKGRVEDSHFGVTLKEWENPSKTTDDFGHGTHVAGIIADSTPDSVIIKPYKVLNSRGQGYTTSIVSGIYRAVEDGADVINLSLGGSKPTSILENAVDFADENGSIVVCAAGNKANIKPHYPAAYQNAVSVSAIDSDGSLAYYSSYGETVDIAAPGSMINSTFLDDEYKELNGTSMAAPFVSSAFAIAKALHPEATNAQLKALLFGGAKLPEIDNADLYFGYGILDANAVLNDVPENIEQYTFADSPTFSIDEGIFKDSLEFTMSTTDGDYIYYTLDGTAPSSDSILYDGNPIKITSSTVVNAITFSPRKKRSKAVQRKYFIVSPVPESEIVITESGVITDCTTLMEEIYIPETVNGIVPISIATDAFSQRNDKTQYVKSLYLPDSIKDIQPYAFYGNEVLERIYANGVESFEDYAFSYCDYLGYIKADSLKHIGDYSFEHVGISNFGWFPVTLSNPILYFPELLSAGENVFNNSAVKSFEAPKLKTIGERCFYASSISNISLPELEELPLEAFAGCRNLQECEFQSVKSINDFVFYSCNSLVSVSLPKCTFAGYCPFSECRILMDLNLPSLVRMSSGLADFSLNIRTLELPSLEEVYYEDGGGNIIHPVQYFIAPKLNKVPEGYFDSYYLKYLSIPGFKDINFKSFGVSSGNIILDISGCETISSFTAFDDFASAEMIIAPSLKSANSLPKSFSMVTSSSLNNISCEIESATFYGIPGSYTENYANENGHKFIPIPYVDNEALPNTVSILDAVSVNAIGFDMTYQWYTSFDGTTENSKAIPDATNKELVVSENFAPYYYCVITCTDSGKTYTATTKAIENSDYTLADYSALNEAVAAVPKDLTIYTVESVSALQNVLDSIDRTLDITKQEAVNAKAQEIINATSALKLKGADYTALDNAIATIPKDLSIYTDESVSALQNVLDNIDRNLDITEQDAVNSKAQEIINATSALKLKGADYTALDNAIAVVPKDFSIYTDESVSALQNVLDSIDRTLDITQQETVNAKAQEIINTTSALKLKGADYSALNDAVAAVPKDLSIYTDESVSALQSAIDAVEYDLGITEQNKVDEYAQKILTATQNLKKLTWWQRLLRAIIAFFNRICSLL